MKPKEPISDGKKIARLSLVGVMVILGFASRYSNYSSRERQERLRPIELVVTQEDKQAFTALLSRAEAGLVDAQIEVAQRYWSGRGVAKNNAAAVTWYRRAVGQGSYDATIGLARMAFTGSYTPENPEAKRALLVVLANEGNEVAQVRLARMLVAGEGGTVDEALAMQWFEKAAELGQADAQYQLGMHYRYDEESPTKAMDWFVRAGRQGQCDAEMEIAKIYEIGWRQAQNFPRANSLYGLADYHHCSGAADAQARVQGLMNP